MFVGRTMRMRALFTSTQQHTLWTTSRSIIGCTAGRITHPGLRITGAIPTTAAFSSAAETHPTTPKPALSTTSLHHLHLAHNAKMVPFAGYSMPLMYPPQTHISEHNFTREQCSIFDVSHMVQHLFTGPGALAFLESLTPADLVKMSPYTSTLSVFLNSMGGIVDDSIITMKAGRDQFYVVTNAGCREKDLAYFVRALQRWEAESATEKGEVVHQVLDGWGLIALQGPEAKSILAEWLVLLQDHLGKTVDLDKVLFGTSFEVSVPVSDAVSEQITVHIARGGYTGEDGFEISIPPAVPGTDEWSRNPTTCITNKLLAIGGESRIQLAGLAARDSLRLEAGMCLYGHDLNEEITPPEASLAWVVHPRRRVEGAFPGAGIITQQLLKGGKPPQRKRVGLDLGVGGPPAREGMKIFNGEEEVGVVTSGGPAISLGMRNIAMGYVKRGVDKIGTKLAVNVRGKTREAQVAKMPFVPTRYWKGEGVIVGK